MFFKIAFFQFWNTSYFSLQYGSFCFYFSQFLKQFLLFSYEIDGVGFLSFRFGSMLILELNRSYYLNLFL